MTTRAVAELKTRARLRLNAARRDDAAAPGKLRDALEAVAREVGFLGWENARRALSGEGGDAGAFWHAPACSSLLNAWFADAGRAREALAATQDATLVPYRRQFIVVQPPYIAELGLDPHAPEWSAIGRDLVAGYGSEAWASLCFARIKAPGARFG